MTADQAHQLGYHIIKASPFEVGLCKGDHGIRTWWASEFERKLPDLDHPTILECIERHEQFLKEPMGRGEVIWINEPVPPDDWSKPLHWHFDGI